MCGIAGLILTPPGPVKKEQVLSLLNRLQHRGPDDSGFFYHHNGKVRLDRAVDEDFIADAVLLHRRLSILDLSTAGWQPMGTRDGRYYVVFNGEIYNYVELRNELERSGYTFRSRSDTEVLLTAYARWGEAALNRFVGMFAFAILDLQDRILFLARDFFGIKPLYYADWTGGFAFASELKAILELPGVSRRAHPQRLYDYLRFGITDHGEETLFLDIRQVPAGHYLKISLDAPREAQPTRYWNLDAAERSECSFDEAACRLRDLFLENVLLHLRSDVPIGAALSGGIDSSSIVMAMRHLEPNLDIHAFSYVADESKLSEEPWVDMVCKAARAKVHKVKPTFSESISDLGHLVSIQEEPFGSTSIYAQRRVFRAAREAGIKVMLDGQGADEILGGYHYYIAARFASLLTQREWSDAIRLLFKASKVTDMGLLPLAIRAADFLIPARFQEPLRALIHKEFSPAWIDTGWLSRSGVQQRVPSSADASFTNGNARELLRAALYETLTHTSLPHLLRYEDRNSMGVSIESRVPFLSPALVQFALGLPEKYVVASDGNTKAVFRKAMRGIVPDAVLDRRDKVGFVTPEKRWLLDLRPWVERVLACEVATQIQAFNWKELRREWQRIVEGRRPFDARVWRWLNTVLWAEKFEVVIH
jgi:asparagine synthase (glutamine-hydrolysing)